MDKKTKQALQRAGFRSGDAEDFLDLSKEERRLVALRVSRSRVARRARGAASHRQNLGPTRHT